jgi:hypothetical protein
MGCGCDGKFLRCGAGERHQHGVRPSQACVCAWASPSDIGPAAGGGAGAAGGAVRGSIGGAACDRGLRRTGGAVGFAVGEGLPVPVCVRNRLHWGMW